MNFCLFASAVHVSTDLSYGQSGDDGDGHDGEWQQDVAMVYMYVAFIKIIKLLWLGTFTEIVITKWSDFYRLHVATIGLQFFMNDFSKNSVLQT